MDTEERQVERLSWLVPDPTLERIVEQALAEDVGSGDVTTLAVVPEGAVGTGSIEAREGLTVAGLEAARKVFTRLDENIVFRSMVADGDRVQPGAGLAEIEGALRSILTGERVALNFLQHLSGIATFTARCREAVAGHSCRITDTRKTTPGLRALEKYAVRCGGGGNHRAGLYDGVLIKDNHIKTVGSIREAVNRARGLEGLRGKGAGGMKGIEVEVNDLAGVEEALAAGAEIIMLDNMGVEEMARAVEMVAASVGDRTSKRPLVEASGGVTLEALPAIARTGVDLISVGALTHSAPAVDIALELLVGSSC